MSYTIPITKEMVTARTDIRASEKAAVDVCRKLNRKDFAKAKSWLEDLVEGTTDIDGKFHTKASAKILELLESLEQSAKNRNIGTEGMQLMISVHRGPTLYRGRRRRNFGLRLKIAKIQAILRPVHHAKKMKEAKKK